MVDGAVLLVDAAEGPLAQTKFVLGKALARGFTPVVVLNKVDKPAVTQGRCDAVASQLFDLFAALGASDHQLDFPLLYASSKQVGRGGMAWGGPAMSMGVYSDLPTKAQEVSCAAVASHTACF
jgi:predicted membrane GTPase involved in stress response